jgi:hypothetical protein
MTAAELQQVASAGELLLTGGLEFRLQAGWAG